MVDQTSWLYFKAAYSIGTLLCLLLGTFSFTIFHEEMIGKKSDIASGRSLFICNTCWSLSLPRPGIQLGSFRSSVWRSPNWAISALYHMQHSVQIIISLILLNGVSIKPCCEQKNHTLLFVYTYITRVRYTPSPEVECWSSGTILALGARAPEFNSQTGPSLIITPSYKGSNNGRSKQVDSLSKLLIQLEPCFVFSW